MYVTVQCSTVSYLMYSTKTVYLSLPIFSLLPGDVGFLHTRFTWLPVMLTSCNDRICSRNVIATTCLRSHEWSFGVRIV